MNWDKWEVRSAVVVAEDGPRAGVSADLAVGLRPWRLGSVLEDKVHEDKAPNRNMLLQPPVTCYSTLPAIVL